VLLPWTVTFLRATGAQAWFGWPDVPKLEAQRLSWPDAPDFAGQQKIAAEIQQTVFDAAPYLPTGQYFASTAW
jgi:peptide/nickel transport system substrate-binding protein